MKNDTVISVKDISKKYTITVGYQADTLRERLVELARSPFKLFGNVTHTKKKTFWALKDINFEVKRGEVVGILGKNGAGKSTLLKILARITEPTTGEIKFQGRVASLLEVGTGFNPELTGRENIFLNGAIIGMTRKEIAQKFNDIVEFSGVREFLDVPVKRYSSGMYVRLAFAVAAHLDADIMLIDEVLAVGDAEFQRKCLTKMSELANSGRTIIFVSHNMVSVQQLCHRGILLSNGHIIADGGVGDVVEKYLKEFDPTIGSTYESAKNPSKLAQIRQVSICGAAENGMKASDTLTVTVKYQVYKPTKFLLCLMVTDLHDQAYMFTAENDELPQKSQKVRLYQSGTYSATIQIPPSTFVPGTYRFYLQLDDPFVKNHDRTPAMRVDISEHLEPYGIHWQGKLLVKARPRTKWQLEQK